MLPALLMLPVAFGANIGPDGTICPDNDKWVPPHYMPVGDGGELVWTEGGCAPKEYEIPEQPSIPNITVIGHPVPRIRIRIYLPPPPPSTPVVLPRYVAPPPTAKPKKKKTESTFRFGICSRPLGQGYSQGRTDEEWEKIQQALNRHDDVTWSQPQKVGGGSGWGPWSWDERKAAGLHPASGNWGALLVAQNVPGVIKTPRHLPPESACQIRSISAMQYAKAASKVTEA